MRKFVLVTFLVITVAVGSVWALSAMGVVDLEAFVFNQLESIPAFADHAAIYRLGRIRNATLRDMEEALARERELLERERVALSAERRELEKEWERVRREYESIAKEREQLEYEWQALYEARSLEQNIDRLIGLYEQMRPEQLALLVAEMDDVLVIRLLLEMDERQASALLARMDPERAGRLSRMIAGERG